MKNTTSNGVPLSGTVIDTGPRSAGSNGAEEIIGQVIRDLSLTLSPEKEARLREDLSNILLARLVKLIQHLVPREDIPTDFDGFVVFLNEVPGIEAQLELEFATFYSDMLMTADIIEMHQFAQSALDKNS